MAVSRPNINAAKGLAFPIAASVFAGAATMFVPAAMLESFTGATGLSEIFPATAAPLGDTARALIAFSTGALTMAMTAILSNRKGPKTMAAHQFKPVFTDTVEEATPSVVSKIMSRLAGISKIGLTLPNMPWRKGAGAVADIRDLDDLPKVRTADSHPDAAPRRPFSAELDLGSVATEIETPTPTPVSVSTPVQAPMPLPTAPFWNDPSPVVTDSVPVSMAAANIADLMPEMISKAPAAETGAVEAAVTDTNNVSPSLADMVVQLELAVQQRQLILDRIAAAQNEIAAVSSAVAANPMAGMPAEEAPAQIEIEQPDAAMSHNDGYVPPYFDRPPLEAVPMAAKPVDDDGEEDEALRAALATLRRMNGQAG